MRNSGPASCLQNYAVYVSFPSFDVVFVHFFVSPCPCKWSGGISQRQGQVLEVASYFYLSQICGNLKSYCSAGHEDQYCKTVQTRQPMQLCRFKVCCYINAKMQVKSSMLNIYDI